MNNGYQRPPLPRGAAAHQQNHAQNQAPANDPNKLDIRPLPAPENAFMFMAAQLRSGPVPPEHQAHVAEVVGWLEWLGSNVPEVQHTEPVILVALSRCAVNADIRRLFAYTCEKIDQIINNQQNPEGGS